MSITTLLRTLPAFLLAVSAASPASAQADQSKAAQNQVLPPAAVPRTEAAALAQGWVLLAEGKHDEASRAAKSVSDRFPRSVSALALTIETDIARGGATTALGSYEAWLGARAVEEPAALRRVARAFLYEWSRQTRDAVTRADALVVLADDGDADAQAVLASGDAGPGARAKAGDDRAVDTLVARLRAAQGVKLREIQALADTGSPRAGAALLPLLADPMVENRMAAAEALGKLEHREAIPRLRPLLKDPRGVVQAAAAGALFRMGDASGAPILDELAASEHSTVRRSAAILMASQPTESWKALVRGLASDPDPSIRLDAARLLAPHDPDFARSLFEKLAEDPNLAIREEAALAMAESPLSGLTELRRLLRTAAGRVKVRAAARILAMTR